MLNFRGTLFAKCFTPDAPTRVVVAFRVDPLTGKPKGSNAIRPDTAHKVGDCLVQVAIQHIVFGIPQREINSPSTTVIAEFVRAAP